jgi:hypothetical protein
LTRIRRRCGASALLPEFGKAWIGRRDPAPRKLLDALAALLQSLIRTGELGLGQPLPFARRLSDMGSDDFTLNTSLDAMNDAAESGRRGRLRCRNVAQQGGCQNC